MAGTEQNAHHAPEKASCNGIGEGVGHPQIDGNEKFIKHERLIPAGVQYRKDALPPKEGHPFF